MPITLTLGDSSELKLGMRCFGMVRLLGIDPTAAERKDRAGQGGRQGGVSRSAGKRWRGRRVERIEIHRASHPAIRPGACALLAKGPAAFRQRGVLTWQRSAARLHRVQQVSREGGHLDLGETPQLQKKGWNSRDIYISKAGRACRHEREGWLPSCSMRWQIWAAGGGRGRQASRHARASKAHLQDVVCGQAVVAPPLAPRHADGLPIEQRAIERTQVSHLEVGGSFCGVDKGAGKEASGRLDVARDASCGLLQGIKES